MKYSARLVTALAAVALLVVAIWALASPSPIQASHGPTHVDGKVYLTNQWSTLTTETPAPTGRTYVGAGKTLYAALKEATSSAGFYINTIEAGADIFIIDVVDPDKNVPIATTSDFIFPSTLATSSSISFALSVDAPIVDRNADGLLNASDVSVLGINGNTGPLGNSTSTVFVSGVLPAAGSNGGVITLTAASQVTSTATTTLGWSTSQQEVITGAVKVTSTQDPTGILVDVLETDRSTGRFRALIELFDAELGGPSTTSVASLSATSGRIKVQNGAQVKAVFTDATPVGSATTTSEAILVVDSGAPTVAITAPAHKSATQDQTPTFSGSVSDTTAGIKKTRVLLFVDVQAEGDGTQNLTAVDVSVSGADDITTSAVLTLGTGSVDGDASITFTATAAANIPTGVSPANHLIDWQIRVSDLAGNIGYSDSDGDPTDNITCTGAATTVCQIGEGNPSGRGAPHLVTIDTSPPGIVNSFTGHYWDATLSTPALAQNRATSIEVLFDSEMDANSIVNTDFLIEIGTATQVPQSAQVFTDAPSSVFLTLGSALKANDTPVVKVVSGVSDKAGNSANTLSKTAIDSLAPTLTVSVSGGSSTANPTTLTNDKMTVTIVSDEPLAGDPLVQISTSTTGILEGVSAIPAINQGSNTWVATFGKTKPEGGARAEGKKSLLVSATDTAAVVSRLGTSISPNGQTTGKVDPAATGAKVFTLDTQAPVATLGTATPNDNRQPFVNVTFNEAVATVNKLTLDGTDISGLATLASDKKSLIYKPTSDLSIADHTIVVQATDDAGNKSAETTLTLKITERTSFELPLKPGWNLVSLRNDPADPSINSVITVTSVSTVITYDPAAQGGPWLVATRVGTGALTGNLTTIDANHGYWINTTTFEPIKVLDPKPQGGSLPPSIPVSAGWNLVPARDVTASKSAVTGDAVATATSYFSNVKVTRAYSFNTLTGLFEQLTLTGASPSNIVVGKGYWVYVTEAGAIVP